MKIQSILAAGLLMMFGACTDLSENLYDKINANEYGQTDSEIASICLLYTSPSPRDA